MLSSDRAPPPIVRCARAPNSRQSPSDVHHAIDWLPRSRTADGAAEGAPNATRRVSTFLRQVSARITVSVLSSLGWLIQTAVGSGGGWGVLRTNRSGWVA